MSKEQLDQLLDELQNEDSRQRLDGDPREKRFRSIDRDTAEFISVLSRMSNPKTILEIGSSVGYSTIWLGLVAKSLAGKVVTFETERWKYELAKQNLVKAGLDKIVTIYNHNPIVSSELIPKNIDLVFLDAEKEDYVKHFQTFFEKLNPGGVIIADNAVSHFADLREYIELVRNHSQINSILLSCIGKGLEISYKIRENELPDWNTLIR